MPSNQTFNGTTYAIPLAGELNWSSLSNFLIDVAQAAGLNTTQSQAKRIATSSPVTVSATTDFCIATNLTVPGAVVVNLPAGVNKQIFVVVDAKGDAATNNITINPNGADTINGGAGLVLNHNRESAVIQYSSADSNWTVISANLPAGTITPADIVGVIPPDKGGTGIANNAASTLAISGNFATTLTVSGVTALTLPTTGTLATLAGAEVLTNKDIDGGTASNTDRITLPQNTTSNLNALTRKEATIVYDSTTQQVKYDDGSVLIPLASVTAGNLTVDLTAVNQTIASGTTLFYPRVTIDTGTTYSVSGTLASIGPITVDGTLTVASGGLVRIL